MVLNSDKCISIKFRFLERPSEEKAQLMDDFSQKAFDRLVEVDWRYMGWFEEGGLFHLT